MKENICERKSSTWDNPLGNKCIHNLYQVSFQVLVRFGRLGLMCGSNPQITQSLDVEVCNLDMGPKGKLITQNFLICIPQILGIIHLRCKTLLSKNRHLIQDVMNCAVKDDIMHIILKKMFTFVCKIFFPEGSLPLY